MAIQFLIGRALSGKTHWILDRLTAEARKDPLGPPLIWLVPEQATFSAEKALLTHGGLRGYTRIHVLSFSRLQEFVFARQPMPKHTRLTQVHRDLLVTLVVAEARRQAELPLSQAVGLEEALSDFVSETKQYALGIKDLQEAIVGLKGTGEGASSPLVAKLEQLQQLVASYDERAKDRFEDPQETLASLSELILKGDMFAASECFVDDFVSLTPVEEQVLVALGKKCRSLTFALMGDPARIDKMEKKVSLGRHPIFMPTEDTYRRLMEVFHRENVPMEPPRLLNGDGLETTDSAAAILEPQFMVRPKNPVENVVGIDVEELPSNREEARRSVEIIASWIEQKGWRPCEVGILTRDLETYASHLEDALHVARLPYFIDRNDPLENHPLINGVRLMIRAALSRRETDSFLALGKAGFLAIPREDADHLEMFVRRFPRKIKEWLQKEDWSAIPDRSPFGDDDDIRDEGRMVQVPAVVERTRRAIAKVINEFRRSLLDPDEKEYPSQGSFLRFVEAIVHCIDKNLNQENFTDTDEKILNQIGSLLAEAVEACGEEVLSWDVCAEIVDRTLSRLSLPRIPPMLDQVFVGQVDRSRQPRLKGVVILGLAEGAFPRVSRNATLLNDQERRRLEELGLALRPDSGKLFDREALYAYRALTTASDEVMLLRARSTRDGKPLHRSPFLKDILDSFPSLKEKLKKLDEENVQREYYEPERTFRARELAAGMLRLIDETHVDLGKFPPFQTSSLFSAHDDLLGNEVATMVREAGWLNKATVTAEELYNFIGPKLTVSSSQLESLARCPFQHFVSYLMRPQTIEDRDFAPSDAGNFAHAVLSRFTAKLRDRGLPVKELSAQEFHEIYKECVAGPVSRLEKAGVLNLAINKAAFGGLQELLNGCAQWVASSLAETRTEPLVEEVRFAPSATATYAPLEIPIPDSRYQVILKGQIDRIDRFHGNNALVVDYKLSARKFDFDKWKAKESLQLPIYLLAVRQQGELEPKGAVYLGIQPDKNKPDRPHLYRGLMAAESFQALEATDKWKGQYFDGSSGNPYEKHRSSGSAIPDFLLEKLLEQTQSMLEELVTQLISGQIAISPSSFGTARACQYCDYRSVCQIDYTRNSARPMMQRGRIAALEELSGGEE